MTVHLSITSSYTLMHSTIRMDALMKDLKAKGYDACALTDHNVLYGAASFLHACNDAGIHGIVGMETDVLYHEKKIPFLLLCKDNRGYRNLLKLSSLINERKEPACTTEEFIQYSNGCVIIAYGEGGWADSELVSEQYEAVDEKLAIMKSELPEFDIALSYQDASLWKNRNAVLKRLCRKNGIRTVAINRVYYLQPQDCQLHRVLSAIRKGILLNDASLPQIRGRYLVPPEEMESLYEADDLARTDEIARMCRADYRLEKAGLPAYPNDAGTDSATYLKSLSYAGLKKRLHGKLTQAYIDRLKYELDVICQMGFADYFLIVYDFVRYGRTHGIYIGPGRGSAAGSLTAYCLGITMVDPLQYNLLFERFLNPQRVSLPDIDTDIPDDKREEIIRYVVSRYGKDHVCSIITFGTFGAKQSIRDVAKAYGLPPREIDAITKLIPNKAKMTLETAMKEAPRFKAMIHSRSIYETVYKTAVAIEGLPRHESIHAAGIIMSGLPLEETVPTVSFGDDILTSQYSMEYLEERGLIKMDFLGLRNLTVIDEIVRKIVEKQPDFKIMSIPMDDPKAYEVFASGDTTGIFQFESEGMKSLLRNMKPKNIEDVACAMALYRPGASSHIPEYLNHIAHPQSVSYPCAAMKPVLESTGGIMIYQEQVMQCAQIMAGFSLAKADNLRRAISKKKMDVMQSMKKEFIDGCVKNGYPQQIGEAVFSQIEQFAGYGFNKSHAIAYSYIAYQLAWLKAHDPLEFYTALLNSCIGDHKKTGQYIDECRRRKITVCYPDVNVSMSEYIHDEATITLPFSVISSIGTQTASLIVKEREKRGPFEDYFDCIARLSMYRITKANLEALIDSGAFDSFDQTRKTMKTYLDDALRYSDLVRVGSDDTMRIERTLVSVPVLTRLAETGEEREEGERKVFGFTLGPSRIASIREAEGIHLPMLSVIQTMGGNVEGFAQIKSIREHRTKKGTMMAFMDIADESAEMEMRVMPFQYMKYNSALNRGSYIVFRAKMTGEGYLIAEDIRSTGRKKGV